VIDKILLGEKKTKKNYTFYLDKHINDKLEFLAKKSGLTKGKVISNLVGMFGDIYSLKVMKRFRMRYLLMII